MPSIGEKHERSGILVVDDSAVNRMAIKAALRGIEHELLDTGSGEDALRLLLERDVSLILLDVQMPGLSGLETARVIRARPRTADLPIIFITGHHPEDDVVCEAYRLGAVDVLFKPLRPEILRSKVSVFVDLQRKATMIARQAARLREHDRLRHERELAEQRRQLEAAALRQQMAEQRRISNRLKEADRRKNEFLAILGHELRNPLVPLVVGLERFAEADLADRRLVRARTTMERQVHHLIRLVDDLLDVSRITSGTIDIRRAPIRVEELADNAVAIARPELETRELELVIEPPAESLWLRGDDVRLTQALANLLNNAARYTEAPGRVTLSWGARGGDDIGIAVTDTGRGMEPELLERAFELFVQERPGSGGLGVGLALARQLVELHGGSISARSDGHGAGSTFEIRLPGGEPAIELVELERPAPKLVPEAELAELSIVVVEDDVELRDVLGELLSDWGHRVELVGTGREGLARIRAGCPDVAVVDIGLPDIDGYQLAEMVRADASEQPPRLIAMTGFGQKSDRDRAMEAGFDAHITKPPELERLQATLLGRAQTAALR